MQINTTEQSSYNWVFVPISSSNFITNGWSVSQYAQYSNGFKVIQSTTQGQYVHFRFRGRRIGIVLAKAQTYGKLSFDVDGTWYGQYDESFADWYQSNTSQLWNIPYVIATDLPEGEHLLTITKPDALQTFICGFMVDDAGHAPTFGGNFNYHQMLDTSNQMQPKAIATTYTSLRNTSTWIYNLTLTNTTASPINITLKNGDGNVMFGPFPVPANDIRQIQGPIYSNGNLSAIASATGVFAILGGQ
jgi:hypothetical protein